MKRSVPLTMEARIQQARRDILRGHSYAHAVSKNPSKAILKRLGRMHLVCVCAVLFAIVGSSMSGPLNNLWPLIALLSALILIASPWQLHTSEDATRYHNALNFLTETYDLRAIGPLAEAYWLRDIPSIVPGALTRLLRVQTQMQVSAALETRQRRCLYRILTIKRLDEMDLQIAILDFLETFGDVRALPAVRAIAEDPTRPPRLQTAALRCHAALETEQAERAGRQTLLRGAPAPPLPAEQLLHPALTAPEPQPEQLLRAANRAE